MAALSIIVPIYNVEKYLPKCIDSILAQTFTDFELILVDDGSPDTCPDICDAYAAKDSRIRVIHKENGGVSSARNAGLDIADGKYIGFVDADDWIRTTMYEELITEVTNHQADMAACGIEGFNQDGTSVGRDVKESWVLETNKEVLAALFGKPMAFAGSCCNKIFRTDSIGNLRFDETIGFTEDWLFLCQYCLACECVSITEKPLYCVLNRDGSATRTNRLQTLVNVAMEGKLKSLEFLPQMSKEIRKLAVDKYLDDCVRYCNEIIATGEEKYRKYILEIRNQGIAVLKKAILNGNITIRNAIVYSSIFGRMTSMK